MNPPDHGGRLDEDDHDLLTFGEAGARLSADIGETRTRIAALERSSGDAAELGRARDRLYALEQALTRNSAPPINDANFEEFFGYPGTARRNVPTPEPR